MSIRGQVLAFLQSVDAVQRVKGGGLCLKKKEAKLKMYSDLFRKKACEEDL